jgi:hypothetical protein
MPEGGQQLGGTAPHRLLAGSAPAPEPKTLAEPQRLRDVERQALRQISPSGVFTTNSEPVKSHSLSPSDRSLNLNYFIDVYPPDRSILAYFLPTSSSHFRRRASFSPILISRPLGAG